MSNFCNAAVEEVDQSSKINELIDSEVAMLSEVCSDEFITPPSVQSDLNVPSANIILEKETDESGDTEIADHAACEQQVSSLVASLSCWVRTEEKIIEPAVLVNKVELPKTTVLKEEIVTDETTIQAEKVDAPRRRLKLVKRKLNEELNKDVKLENSSSMMAKQFPLLMKIRNLDNPGKVQAVGNTFVNRNPLIVESVSDMCNQEWLSEFNDWICVGTYKKKHEMNEIYYPNYKTLRPVIRLGGEGIVTKDFFYKLHTAGAYLDSSHIDCLFSYLRKKCLFLNNDYSVCGNFFDQYVQNGYLLYQETRSVTDLPMFAELYNFIVGEDGAYKRCWSDVKNILFPVHLKVDGESQDHWILAKLSFEYRTFFVYNSRRSELYDNHTATVMTAYATLLPLILDIVGFYDRSDINFHSVYYMDKSKTDPFAVAYVDRLPVQEKADCGLYIVAFAEYLIEGKAIPRNIDVFRLRERYATNLYIYERWKIKTKCGYISE
ncbi:uncharacterized protein LOC126671989 [Mercurialis annua]|uniref:uncharacterized protein LOC126671989 n=1 Tax=Mercurialis annua TaxID=3986 RepID=UPI0024AFBEB0|nr:uncharacterized protein LOC126671989 [Mercurialis annua]